MTKKILILSLAILLLPVICFGVVNYERTPSGYTITNPVNFEISFDDMYEICPAVHPWEFWKVSLWGEEVGSFYTEEIPISTKNYIFSETLPLGEYWWVASFCRYGETKAEGFFEFEGTAEEVIFEVVEDEEPTFTIFSITGTDITTLLANVSGLFTDAGLFIWVVIGLPLGFYVIKRVIALIPKDKK